MIGPTPENETDFTVEWVTPILHEYLKKSSDTFDPNDIEVIEVRAKKNVLQGSERPKPEFPAETRTGTEIILVPVQ